MTSTTAGTTSSTPASHSAVVPDATARWSPRPTYSTAAQTRARSSTGWSWTAETPGCRARHLPDRVSRLIADDENRRRAPARGAPRPPGARRAGAGRRGGGHRAPLQPAAAALPTAVAEPGCGRRAARGPTPRLPPARRQEVFGSPGRRAHRDVTPSATSTAGPRSSTRSPGQRGDPQVPPGTSTRQTSGPRRRRPRPGSPARPRPRAGAARAGLADTALVHPHPRVAGRRAGPPARRWCHAAGTGVDDGRPGQVGAAPARPRPAARRRCAGCRGRATAPRSGPGSPAHVTSRVARRPRAPASPPASRQAPRSTAIVPSPSTPDVLRRRCGWRPARGPRRAGATSPSRTR